MSEPQLPSQAEEEEYARRAAAAMKRLKETRRKRLADEAAHPWKYRWIRFKQRAYDFLCNSGLLLWRATIGRWIYVKFTTPYRARAEILNLRFARKHTSIPVPRPLFWFTWPSGSPHTAYVLMTRARGTTLDDSWLTVSVETRRSIALELSGYVAQLRAMQSQYGSRICSVTGGPVYDMRLFPSGVCGPFADEAAMNAHLVRHLKTTPVPPAVAKRHAISHLPITFTHGDLAPRNIMIHNSRISAIIDWETAGWYPAHWESVKAHFSLLAIFRREWEPLLPLVMDTFMEDVIADSQLAYITWSPHLDD